MTKSPTAGTDPHPNPLDHDADGHKGGSRPKAHAAPEVRKEEPGPTAPGSASATSASAGAAAAASASGAPTASASGDTKASSGLDAAAVLGELEAAALQERADYAQAYDTLLRAGLMPPHRSLPLAVLDVIERLKTAEAKLAEIQSTAEVATQEAAAAAAKTPATLAPAGDPAPPHLARSLAAIAGQRLGLYFFPDKGFATQGGGPFVSMDEARELADLGLVAADSTGGAHGSVKATDAGRAAVQAAQ